jgi:hypothetical protein
LRYSYSEPLNSQLPTLIPTNPYVPKCKSLKTILLAPKSCV